MFRRVLAFGVALAVGSGAYGDIYIDLRPDHPGPYAAGEVVNVEAWFVDDGTGNPFTHGDILFRSYGLDFEDSDPVLGLPDEMDMETDEFGINIRFPELPRPLLIFPLSNESELFQMTLPFGGEMLIGNVDITLNDSGWLDVMNPEEDENLGAWIRSGFAVDKDHETFFWRAYTGELTGGRLFMEVPEPASMVLLALGGTAVLRGRGAA